MKKFISIFIVLSISLIFSCSQKIIKPDSQITGQWFEPPYEDVNSKLSHSEANEFVDQFFSLTEQVIFDPTYRSNDLIEIKNKVKSEIHNSLILTRLDLITSLNKKINSIKFSHLGAFNPEKFLKIIQMAGMRKDHKAQSAVTAYVKNQTGVISISSFLVPSITLDLVNAARSKVKSSKYLIYDLRNNGGGSASSISYLIETILGPNKTIQYSRTRKGLTIATPIVMNGYFKDELNFGSVADIEFDNKNHYVEYKTSKSAIIDNRPTIIIVNSNCASSCDIFAAAIKESKTAKILGTKTAGQVLGTIAYKLNWKGYTALMPATQIISPQGKLYEGIGIEPDLIVKSCENPKDEKCVDEAIKNFNN